MTSRTPIRLTPHRGPLATPSTSPESSPTLSTPPTDISQCSAAIRQALDAAILQHRISALSSPMRHQSQSSLYRRRREVIRQGIFGRSTHLYALSLIFESLMHSACDLAKSLAGIVTFCLLIWGLLGLVFIRLLTLYVTAERHSAVLVYIRTTSTTKFPDINVTIPPSIPHQSSALSCESFTM